MAKMTTEQAVQAALEKLNKPAVTTSIRMSKPDCCVVDDERHRRGLVGHMPDGRCILSNPGLGLYPPKRPTNRPQSGAFQRLVSQRAFAIHQRTGSDDHVRNWYQAEAEVLNMWVPRKHSGD